MHARTLSHPTGTCNLSRPTRIQNPARVGRIRKSMAGDLSGGEVGFGFGFGFGFKFKFKFKFKFTLARGGGGARGT